MRKQTEAPVKALLQTRPLAPDCMARIDEYLKDPIVAGVWIATAEWLDLEGVSRDLWAAAKPHAVDTAAVDPNYSEKEILAQLATKNQIQKLFSRCTSQISPLFRLAEHVEKRKSNLGAAQKEIKYLPWYDRFSFEALEQTQIAEKYQDAFEWFSSQIAFSDFSFQIVYNRPFQIKGGYVCLTVSPDRGRRLVLCSTERESLEVMMEFLVRLGKIQNCRLRKIHSIAEGVFEPFVSILQLRLPQEIEREDGRSIFEPAIAEYRARRYDNCIRFLGLECESYLRQMYETRQLKPAGSMMLGILASTLWEPKSGEKEYPVEDQLNKVYRNLRKLTDRMASPHPLAAGDVVEKLQVVLEGVRSATEGWRKSKSRTPDQTSPFWSADTYSLVTEFIEYRNLAAHLNRRTVGSYEAQRALYCLLHILERWRIERAATDRLATQQAE